MSRDIVENMKEKSWQNYSTFSGHPITVAAIRAYFKVVEDEDLLAGVRKLEKVFKKRLLEIAAELPSVASVDGYGLHRTVELHGPDWRDWEINTAETRIASRVSAKALEAGAMIGTSGEQTSLFIAPPLIVTEDEAECLFAALDEGLSVADVEQTAA